jgi:ATP-dependent helicase/nuclease subunit A
LTDEDLLRFAPQRKGSLRQALRQLASKLRSTPVEPHQPVLPFIEIADAGEARPDDARLVAADARLDDMREAALKHGAFGFLAWLLGPEGGRKALASRLGPEAAEASDEVLRLALLYERSGKASLAGFLDGLETSGADIKRDLSTARGEVRVMTVHGAKGLEAPIVILADACAANERTGRLFPLALPGGREVPVWVPRKELDCSATAAGRIAIAEDLAREDRRLLYVAMTRARDRLIVAGCPHRGKVPETSWYAMVERGLAASSQGLVDLAASPGEAPVRRFRVSREVKPRADALAARLAEREAVPEWLYRQAPAEPVARPPLRPSSALDAADAAGSPELPVDREALMAGRFAHTLLEYLPSVPPAERGAVAEALSRDLGSGLAPERCGEIVDAVRELIAHSPLRLLFSEESLAEVSVTGDIELKSGHSCAVSGRIDRLAVTDDAVLVADFKTSLPETSAARERATLQLAIYRALLRKLYPGRPIRCFLIGLDGPRWREPVDSELEAALSLISTENAPIRA